MTTDLADLLQGVTMEPARPLPTLLVDEARWRALGPALAADPAVTPLGLFVAVGRVNAMVLTADGPLVVAMALAGDRYPALSPALPVCAWFERLARDLTGVAADGAVDDRPAVIHRGAAAAWPEVSPPTADGAYQIGEGPVAGLTARPLHRRIGVAGDAVVGLEHRLGYAHRGVTALMQGRTARAAAPLAARISGPATVAHSLAFARAVEAALGVVTPEGVEPLREAMAAVERGIAAVAVLGDLAEATGFDRLATRCAEARHAAGHAAEAAFFHPLMMDAIGPGGLAAWPEPQALESLGRALAAVATLLRAGGGARLRLACGDAAFPLGDLLRSGLDAVRAGRAALGAVRPGETAAIRLPAEGDGTGIGAARSLAGPVHHWVTLRQGRIAGVFAIDPGVAILRRLEREAAGLTPEALRLRALAAPLAVSGVDL